MWAEWSAATRGTIDPATERRRLWPIEVTDLPVLDLRRSEAREALGVTIEELIGPRQSAQAIVAPARALGAAGLIAPSAARRGTCNLVVFPEGFTRLKVGRSRSMNPDPPGRSVSRRAADG